MTDSIFTADPITKVVAEVGATVEDSKRMEQVLEQLTTWGVDIGKHLLIALVVFIVGRFLVSLINRLVANMLIRRKVEPTIQTFLRSFTNIVLMILLVVSVVGALGVNPTSYAALLASAGVAVGMALSGNLQNLAGGLIVLLFKPFKVGDWIEAQDVSGTVTAIQIFHTILTTGDNKMIYVPNGALSSGVITNYSQQGTRRLEWVVGVEYGADLDKVQQTVLEIIAADKRILDTPAPLVVLSSLSASSVDMTIRVWAASSDYWSIYFDMNRKIYDEFNRRGIDFPYPQLTVHQA